MTTTFKWFLAVSVVVFGSGFIAHSFSGSESATAPATGTATQAPTTETAPDVAKQEAAATAAIKAERTQRAARIGMTLEQYDLQDGVAKLFQKDRDKCHSLYAKPISELNTYEVSFMSGCGRIEKEAISEIPENQFEIIQGVKAENEKYIKGEKARHDEEADEQKRLDEIYMKRITDGVASAEETKKLMDQLPKWDAQGKQIK